ncbi:MAG: hypothetical protein MMC23_003171 [Stictis urceolatum]|nr:hypothetical protein [Stictis urceolata]
MPAPSPFIASATKPRPAPPPYRAARQLPFELEEQVRIYLEEALCTPTPITHLSPIPFSQALTSTDPQALHLLLKFLLSGLSSPLASSAPAYTPPPSHLALISTLALHPSFTTRTHDPDKLESSSLALQYLNLLLSTLGPRASGLGKAYAFPATGSVSRRGTATRRRERSSSPTKNHGSGVGGIGEGEEEIASDLAGPGSVWVCAGDFWAAVGWAFNCSVAHKRRWERWRLWLDHVVEVMERDWQVRTAGGDTEKEIPGRSVGAGESLVARFVEGADSRRIMRAVWANGGDVGKEFGEVWRNETRERRGDGKGRGREKVKVKVDVENGEFGDYFKESEDEEDDDEEEPEESRKSRIRKEDPDTIMLDVPAATSLPSGSLPLGGPESLHLRMRLISLLVQLSGTQDDRYPVFAPLIAVLHELSLHIRTFPLVTFATILSSPYLESFRIEESLTLLQYIARSYLEASAPLPEQYELSQDRLVSTILPFAANTQQVAENAKLGAIVETLTRMYDRVGGLYWTEDLERASEKGIRKREEKAKKVVRKKGEAGSGSGDVDLTWLRGSGERIRLVVAMAKERDERENENRNRKGMNAEELE